MEVTQFFGESAATAVKAAEEEGKKDAGGDAATCLQKICVATFRILLFCCLAAFFARLCYFARSPK